MSTKLFYLWLWLVLAKIIILGELPNFSFSSSCPFHQGKAGQSYSFWFSVYFFSAPPFCPRFWDGMLKRWNGRMEETYEKLRRNGESRPIGKPPPLAFWVSRHSHEFGRCRSIWINNDIDLRGTNYSITTCISSAILTLVNLALHELTRWHIVVDWKS